MSLQFDLPRSAEEVFMKIIVRILSAVLALSLLLISFSAVAFASEGTDSFNSAVAAIDANGNYLKRKTDIDNIMAKYEALSESDKALVADSYQLALAELAKVEELARAAEAFISAVKSLDMCNTLIDKELVINRATSGLFSDESYEGITEALATYTSTKASVEATVEKCNQFLEYIDTVSILEEDDYLGIKAALDAAKALLPDIDLTYYGVQGAYEIYNEAQSLIGEKEYYTRDWINSVREMDALTVYKYKRASYETLQLTARNELFLPDYADVPAALELMAAAEEYFRACISAGNAFIRAVDDIESADSVGEGLINAYAKCKGVDKTVDGVSSAYSTFKSTLDDYNDVIEQMNAWMEGADS